MKIIETDSFLAKSAGSWDTQPGWKSRDHSNTALLTAPQRGGESKSKIKERWDSEDSEKVLDEDMKNIYQLGIEVPKTDRDEI